MKKSCFCITLSLLILCGCGSKSEISDTRFMLDTVVTLTASCDEEAIDGAFSLCQNYENLLSRTVKGSDVYTLNSSTGETEVSSETAKIIERSIYYSQLSDGKFDITIYPLSSIWNFSEQIVPSKDEIAEALKNIDYQSIEINGNKVNLNGKKIDLGSIAKGYIADKVKDYLVENGAENGIVNLGGNVVVFGKEYTVGIRKPFSEDIAASIKIKDKSVVTSGIYERYIEENGKFYHHVLDTKTGYGVENELASVTIIGDSSMDCDALSTVCLLSGTEKGLEIIENTEDFEAVFIDKNEKIILSSGLEIKNDKITLK